MQKLDVRVDVTDAVCTGEKLATAATLVLPDLASSDPPYTVLFGYPGGGYNRRYFDLPVAAGYSQAAFHGQDGLIFAACDHLGVGDSDVPGLPLTFEAIARANAETARVILARLRTGTLAAGIPPLEIACAIGIGHSFGGFLLTLAQASEAVFDAIALLGWSGVGLRLPWATSAELAELERGAGVGRQAARRRAYFHDDVPGELVDRDFARGAGRVGSTESWGTSYYPGGPALTGTRTPLEAGAVAAEAAELRCALFIGAGDVDLIGDIRREPTAYPRASDLTLCVFAGMGHAHNFAGSRQSLWRRLGLWAMTVAATHGHPPATAPGGGQARP